MPSVTKTSTPEKARKGRKKDKEVRVMYASWWSMDRDCENDSIVNTSEYHEESQFLELR